MSGRRHVVLAVALAVLVTATGSATAQKLDAASSEALAAVLKMLTDPAARSGAIAGNPGAAATDKQIRSMAGSEQLTQEVYQLAAEIFAELTRGSGGDLKKMTEALERGKGDPAGFAALLSPATLERLRQLSGKMSDQKRR